MDKAQPWSVDRVFGARSIVSRGFIEPQLAPGQTSPNLAFSAIGLPGIVRYWGVPFVAPDTVETPDVPGDMTADPSSISSASGATVGVVLFPAVRTRPALLARLERLLDPTCKREWIDDAATCSRLRHSLAERELREFVHALTEAPEHHVNANAYFLLVGNVRALPPGPSRAGDSDREAGACAEH